jgi:hypothetical protein
MAQTKKQQEEVKKLMLQSPPKDEKSYLFDITGCPGYEGYTPKRLGNEVCKYCGSIKYYH